MKGFYEDAKISSEDNILNWVKSREFSEVDIFFGPDF